MMGRASGTVCAWMTGALGLSVSGCQASAATLAPVVVSPSPAPSAVTRAAAVPSVPVRAAEPPRFAELARRASDVWVAAFKARDADKLASVYAEDACVTSPGRPRVCGRSAIAEAARAVWAKLPEVRTAWGRTWQSGDLLAVESAWSTEARGAVALALCWLTPDGLIREEHVYADGRPMSASSAPSSPKGRPFDGLPTTRETHESSGAADEQANVELFRASFAAPVLADDAELLDFTQSGSLVGKKYATRWVSARTSGLADARVELAKSWAVESYLLCEYETTGRRPGGPRGETFTLHGAEVLQLEGGKVKRGWRYEDALEATPTPSGLPLFPLAVP
jgi:hypothetical protein